jgi:hypothetical protein
MITISGRKPFENAITVTEISPLDHILLQLGIPTAAMSTLAHQVERKKQREANPIAHNLELIRENRRLKHEIALYRARERALVTLFHNCVDIQQQLRNATTTFSETVCKSEAELLTNLGLDINTAGLNDFNLI